MSRILSCLRPWFQLAASVAAVAFSGCTGVGPHEDPDAAHTAADAVLAPVVAGAGGLASAAGTVSAAASDSVLTPEPSDLPTDPSGHAVLVHLALQLDPDLADADRAQRISFAVAGVLDRAPAASLQITRRYNLLASLAVVATDAGLAALEADEGVSAVSPDETWTVGLAEVAKVIGAAAISPGAAKVPVLVTGKGVRVAVVDTGVAGSHPDLAGRVVAEQCFAWGACPPSGANQGPVATDSHGHGTHVAGIIAGQGKVASPGIAPGAQIVAVRVTDKKGRARASDILAGLDWVATQSVSLGIQIINVSLGGGTAYKKACDGWQPAAAAAVAFLAAKGVAVFAAAGNDGAPGVSAPACVTYAIAVGATYDAKLPAQAYANGCADLAPKPGMLACFSNHGANLDLVAPGARVHAAKPGGGVAAMSGTSQASPVAAAVAALVLSCQPKLGVAKLRSLLRTTGQAVAMPGGSKVSEVRAALAVQMACGKPGP